MVNVGGGLTAFNPDQGGGIQEGGTVSISPYQSEKVSTLTSGVRYDGDYRKMTDNPRYAQEELPANANEYYQTLVSNHNRTNANMKVDVTLVTAPTFTVDVYLDDNLTYSDGGITLPWIGYPTLQGHWGSGVVFTDLAITPKEYFEQFPPQ